MYQAIRKILIFLFTMSSFALGTSEKVNQTAFWIGTGDNAVFDQLIFNHINQYGDEHIILESPDGNRNNREDYTYKETVYRFKKFIDKTEGRPQGILGHTWSRYGGTEGPQIGHYVLKKSAYPNDFVEFNNKIIYRRSKQYYGNLIEDKFIEWLVGRIEEVKKDYELDGFLLDGTVPTPEYDPYLIRKSKNNPEWSKAYTRALGKLFYELSKKMITYFNGLTHHSLDKLGATEKDYIKDSRPLLKESQGAIIEYFGRYFARGKEYRKPFKDMLQQIALWYKYRDSKHFKVFSKSSRNYIDYQKDYLEQRYYYSAYLLGAGTNTSFQYHSTKFVPARRGRNNGLTVFQDSLFDLGKPISGYKMENGIYKREFEKALVVVNPHDSNQSYEWSGPRRYTLDGRRVTRLMIPSGQGHVLFKNIIRYSQRDLITFHEKQFQRWKKDPWPNSFLEEDHHQNPRYEAYMSLKHLDYDEEHYHDILLSPVKKFSHASLIDLDIRSSNQSGKVILVAEVDDKKKEYNFVQFELEYFKSKAGAIYLKPRKFFRSPNIISENNYKIPTFTLPIMQGDMKDWQSIRFHPNSVMKKYSHRFKFKKWHFARFTGDIDVAHISVGR